MNSGSPRFMTRAELTWATHRVFKEKQHHRNLKHPTSEGGMREKNKVQDEKPSISNMAQVRNGFPWEEPAEAELEHVS